VDAITVRHDDVQAGRDLDVRRSEGVARMLSAEEQEAWDSIVARLGREAPPNPHTRQGRLRQWARLGASLLHLFAHAHFAPDVPRRVQWIEAETQEWGAR
jgi:uncharacterized damage-inducible protein DinB